MAPTPIATGTLERTPLPQVLLYLEQRSLSGTLAIWPEPGQGEGAGQDRLLILKGQLVGARFLHEVENLESGVVALFARIAAPYAFYEGNLLGDASRRHSGRLGLTAIVARWLRSPTARDELVDQLLLHVDSAQRFVLRAGADVDRFEFDEVESGVLRRLGLGPATLEQLAQESGIDPRRARRVLYLLLLTRQLSPVSRAAGNGADSAGPTAELPRPAKGSPRRAAPPSRSDPALRGSTPRAASEAAAHPASPGADCAVTADRLSVPQPPSASSGRRSSPPKTGRASLRPELASVPAPPEALSAELRERWRAIEEVCKRIEQQNYFEMLGVSQQSGEKEARAAFMRMAKDWHPDRLPRELSVLKGHVQAVFGYLSEANSCLCDDAQRVAYLHTVKDGGGTPATHRLMKQIVDSAMQYERVLVYTRKRDYRAALGLLKHILEVTKDEPDYHAMYAWVLLQLADEPDVHAGYQEMLDAVDRALALHPQHERANLHKAQIYRRLGRRREALEYFTRVVAINANNVEAARELRIAQMRGESQPPGAAKRRDSSGLLGKLFGKK